MIAITLHLPDTLKAFVDRQVASGRYATPGDYVLALIHQDQERWHMRRRLVDGAASPPGSPADAAYFQALRDRVARSTGTDGPPPLAPPP